MIKGIIFDMDGVISDTQNLQASVEESLLKKYGIKMTADEITDKYAGIADREWFQMIINDFNLTVDLAIMVDQKWAEISRIAKNNIKEITGAIELINKFKVNNFKLAVASASPFEFINLVLSELKIKDQFDIITSATELEKGKPDPQIFLLTAQRLNSKPEECLVIEDGINGMIAAESAGMRCIGLVKTKDYNKYPTDLLVNSLKEIQINDIQKL